MPGSTPRLGRRVVVYGGGNTAMDAARTARRLGADEALIVYHRDRAHMPAHDFEADEAIAEGVKIKWLTTIKEIVGTSLTVERMALDENGWPQPTGEIETLEADAVVLALGQADDSGFLRTVPGIEFKADGTVIVDATADDRARRASSPAATWSRRAHRHGRGRARQDGPRTHRRLAARRHYDAAGDGAAGDVRDAEPAGVQRRRPGDAARRSDRRRPSPAFEEVVSGLNEARRGTRHNVACPAATASSATIASRPAPSRRSPARPRSRLPGDADLCTGCATCFEQCPCHAIDMTPDDLPAMSWPEAFGEPLAPHLFRLRA